LPKNVIEFLEANGKTLEDWIAEQIEIAVQQQK
jgi:spore cortex formation protein SpoVR/YcgB (stage V sporulation)